jgi:hypothetical protein
MKSKTKTIRYKKPVLSESYFNAEKDELFLSGFGLPHDNGKDFLIFIGGLLFFLGFIYLILIFLMKVFTGFLSLDISPFLD